MSFERIKPVERRLDDRGDHGPGDDHPDMTGRSALFSTTSSRTSEDQSPLVAASCARCGATTPLDLRRLVRVAFPVVVVAPWRSHPVFARCPACQQRAWLRPVAPGALGASESTRDAVRRQ